VPRGFEKLPHPEDYDRRLAEVVRARHRSVPSSKLARRLFDKTTTPQEQSSPLEFLGVSPARPGPTSFGFQIALSSHGTLDRERIAASWRRAAPDPATSTTIRGLRVAGLTVCRAHGALFLADWVGNRDVLITQETAAGQAVQEAPAVVCWQVERQRRPSARSAPRLIPTQDTSVLQVFSASWCIRMSAPPVSLPALPPTAETNSNPLASTAAQHGVCSSRLPGLSSR